MRGKKRNGNLLEILETELENWIAAIDTEQGFNEFQNSKRCKRDGERGGRQGASDPEATTSDIKAAPHPPTAVKEAKALTDEEVQTIINENFPATEDVEKAQKVETTKMSNNQSLNTPEKFPRK